jgi:hypothetical protein
MLMRNKCVWTGLLGALLLAAPSPALAQGSPVTYRAILTGSGESPAVVRRRSVTSR